MATCAKLMPYLHLPVQSGSDRILKRMNRSHTAESYLRLIERIRAARPDIVLSGDFIVGFPEETEADFQATLDLIEEVNYGYAYSFKYSTRPGTPAAERPQVDAAKATSACSAFRRSSPATSAQSKRRWWAASRRAVRESRAPAGQMVGKSDYLHAVHVDRALLRPATSPGADHRIGTNSLAGVPDWNCLTAATSASRHLAGSRLCVPDLPQLWRLQRHVSQCTMPIKSSYVVIKWQCCRAAHVRWALIGGTSKGTLAVARQTSKALRGVWGLCRRRAVRLCGDRVQRDAQHAHRRRARLFPTIWVDPDGCEHWVMDDGAEGYMTPHTTRQGIPVCRRGNVCGVMEPDQFFATDSYRIRQPGRQRLAKFFADARGVATSSPATPTAAPRTPITCACRCNRANAVAAVAQPTGARIADVRGYGERMPAGSNSTAAGMAKNRRVEIICIR